MSPSHLFLPTLLILLNVIPARAQEYVWSDQFAGVGLNGYASRIAVSGDHLVVAGNFSHVGPIASTDVALWDGYAWHSMGNPGWVETFALGTYNGEFYAHGFLGNALRKWTGTDWAVVGSLALVDYNTMVRALVEYEGKLIIGGERFLEIDGLRGLFAYDGSAFVDMGNKPDLGLGAILDLAVYAGELYVAGSFEMTTDSIATSGIARWNGSTWSAVEGRSAAGSVLVEGLHVGSAPGVAYALAVHENKLVISGNFDHAGDLPVSNICSWDASTMLWEDLGGGSSETIPSLASVGGRLFAGAGTMTFGDQTIENLAQWDGVRWAPVGSGASNTVLEVAQYGGNLAVVGFFKSAGGLQAEHLAIWDGQEFSSMLIPGGQGLDDRLHALVHSGGSLVAVGRFPFAGTQRVNHVAAWDGTQWSDLAGGSNAQIHCALADGADLIVGGEFSQIGGIEANYVARWDGTSWHAYGVGPPEAVTAMTVHDGELYVGGEVGFDGYLRRWNGSSWQTIDLGPFNRRVEALASYGGELIASSEFWEFPEGFATVARYDGSTWRALPSSHGTIGDNVLAFFHSQGELYIGGVFAHLGGSWPSLLWTSLRTGRWDGSTLRTLQPSDVLNGGENGVGLNAAYAFAEYDGRMFIGGTPDYRRGALWASDLMNPWEIAGNDVNNRILAMASYDERLYVGGLFSEVGASRVEPGQGIASSFLGALQPGPTATDPESPPLRLELSIPRPNPFNPSTEVSFQVPEGTRNLSLDVYDLRGRLIRTLLEGLDSPATNEVIWDGRNDRGDLVASGVYLFRLVADEQSVTQRAVLLK
jgi:hypothetical protein